MIALIGGYLQCKSSTLSYVVLCLVGCIVGYLVVPLGQSAALSALIFGACMSDGATWWTACRVFIYRCYTFLTLYILCILCIYSYIYNKFRSGLLADISAWKVTEPSEESWPSYITVITAHTFWISVFDVCMGVLVPEHIETHVILRFPQRVQILGTALTGFISF